MLHLGNAGQLGFQPLLLLGQRETRRCVQLLEAPASLPVELEQVGVVLPGRRAGRVCNVLRLNAILQSAYNFTFLLLLNVVKKIILPQGRSVCDGEQRDAGVLSSLENLPLHVNAHSAGALIQQRIFGPGEHRGSTVRDASD